MVKCHALFTGLFRNEGMPPTAKVKLLKEAGVEIHWYTWKGYVTKEATLLDINIVEVEEPEDMSHSKSIMGRQRQIFNVKAGLKNIPEDDIVLKTRWDVDFNQTTIDNITNKNFFEPVKNGVINNKIWTGFYSIQELFSPADLMYAGYQRNLNKLIQYKYMIEDIPSDNYISHDGMQLMPTLIANNKEICEIIKLKNPDPWSLMFKESHVKDKKYITAWAYSYYLLNKYFQTGPKGTCYFPRGDTSRWPGAIVDYGKFYENYKTVTSNKGRICNHPRYRVYDDIFVKRLVNGEYTDNFANSIASKIKEREWL